MIYCKSISDKRGLIEYFYRKEDQYFFENIHKCGGSMEECVEDSIKSIDEGSSLIGVYDDEKLVAYFARYTNETDHSLNGFHVLKEYRTRDFLNRFWDIVKTKFGSTIYTGIYVRNEPAIRSLMKAGFSLHRLLLHDNKVFLILKF